MRRREKNPAPEAAAPTAAMGDGEQEREEESEGATKSVQFEKSICSTSLKSVIASVSESVAVCRESEDEGSGAVVKDVRRVDSVC